MKTRYFIIFYVALDLNNRQFFGTTSIKSVSGGFPSYSKYAENMKKDFKLTSISPMNILELNEADFNDWEK